MNLRTTFSAFFILAISVVAQTYTISTIAGSLTSGFSGDNGPAASATLSGAFGVTIDTSGNLYIADQNNHRIRKVTTDGTISTVAGNGTPNFTGDGGSPTSATLSSPQGVAVDSSGNLYIADSGNHVIRKVAGGKISTIAGTGQIPGLAGDTGAATGALLNHPSALALDAAGNLYIADTSNNVIRKLDTKGIITTFAGYSGADFSGDGGPATKAALNNPSGIAVDSAGRVYIADTRNSRIRIVTTDGNIATFAGTSLRGFSGDGGPATKAEFSNPEGVTVDSAGNVIVVDSFNNRIRRITLDGNIATIAGSNGAGSSGDGGPATKAQLKFPSAAAVDSAGRVYIADNQNNSVRLLTPSAPEAAPPVIFARGVGSAAAFGGFGNVAAGTWIEIYGSNLATSTRLWKGSDFVGVNAPTSLDGVSVSIGGQPALVDYVSPGQVNAQIPTNVGTGPQQLILTNTVASTAAYSVTVNATLPGLLAPPSFVVGGKQYVTALFSDGATYVLPTGAIAGVASRPAKAGETITLYGIGFGPVTPAPQAGQVVQAANTLTLPLQIQFGGVDATASYAGLAPGQIGLYQFNVVVPNVGANDALPLTFSLGGTAGTQTLVIAVQN